MKDFLYSLPKSERNPSFAIGYPILAGMVDAILNAYFKEVVSLSSS